MDPQAFIRLSIGSLGLRLSGTTTLNSTKSGISAISSPCVCEIRLRGFPVQTSSVPYISSPEATPDIHNVASSFYLEESDLKALLTPGCFYAPHACLEIVVFTGRKGGHCGVGIKRQQVGTFKLEVGPEWGEGKPAILFNGWIGIGKNKLETGKPGAELHLRVKLDPDPRYVFQFEDKTKLSPQIVQLQGTIKQPIFSCEFSQDRVSPVDPLNNFWSSSFDGSELEVEKRERKGWKVKIHDLSGSAVAAAFITTPFVPSTGCDWVAKSNPGAWLIVRPDICRPESWQPWGKLEAWRERGIRDSICCRFHLLSEGQECGGDLLMSEILISAEKGGEFYIDTDRQVQAAASPLPSPRSSGDFAALSPVAGGFVMSCRVCKGKGNAANPSCNLPCDTSPVWKMQPFSWRLLLQLILALRHAGLFAESYGEVLAIPGDVCIRIMGDILISNPIPVFLLIVVTTLLLLCSNQLNLYLNWFKWPHAIQWLRPSGVRTIMVLSSPSESILKGQHHNWGFL